MALRCVVVLVPHHPLHLTGWRAVQGIVPIEHIELYSDLFWEGALARIRLFRKSLCYH